MVNCYLIYSVTNLTPWPWTNYPAAPCQADPPKTLSAPASAGNQMLESSRWQINQALESTKWQICQYACFSP